MMSGPGMVVRLLKNARYVSGLALLCALAGQGHAQAIRSELSAQARATITISVSVKPTFAVSAPGGPFAVSSNVSPNVRYAVVRAAPESADGGQSGASGTAFAPEQDRLVLIVPD
jgi:hypothetical protein